ncbi:MAG: beta-methylgalactoside transporter, partial [Clostridia bacterium]
INILTLSASRLVMALGIAGCIVLTGTDLSAGKMLGLAMVICASLLQEPDYVLKMFPGVPWLTPIVPLLIVMVVCGLLGMFNGFCVAKFKLHPFIVTLGTQLMIFGLALIYVTLGTNKGAPIGGLDERYTKLIIGDFLGVPRLVWYSAVVAIIMWFVWNKTIFGKNMFAVGCNEEAAKVSGVSVFWTITLVFALAGVLYGVTGFFESARLGSNIATAGDGAELDAIAACVIGGVSFTGGVGKIRGVIMGVILLQLINAALVFLDVPGAYTYIVRGAIILVACAIDMRKYMVKK